MLRRGEAGAQRHEGAEQGRRDDCGDIELDNLRAAIQFALQAPDATAFVATKIVVALQHFWILHGHVSEAGAQVAALQQVQRVRSEAPFHSHVVLGDGP